MKELYNRIMNFLHIRLDAYHWWNARTFQVVQDRVNKFC